jgi:hypothetical protein
MLLAVMLAGAGHGWTTPLLVSIPLWVLYPLTFYVARQDAPHARPILWVLAIIALGSNTLLVMGTIGEASYIAAMMRVNGVAGYLIAAGWCALWIVWQAVLFRSLLAHHVADPNA